MASWLTSSQSGLFGLKAYFTSGCWNSCRGFTIAGAITYFLPPGFFGVLGPLAFVVMSQSVVEGLFV